jgi:hypothetical protein
MALSLCSSAANTRILGWRFHCVQAQQIQKEFIRMSLSLCSSAANTRILGWRFHFVQAQRIQKEFIRMSLSQSESDILSYWAYPKPFKNISGADVFAFAFSSPH